MRRIASALLVVLLLMAIVVSPSVSAGSSSSNTAASSCAGQNKIMAGLWAGVNAALGTTVCGSEARTDEPDSTVTIAQPKSSPRPVSNVTTTSSSTANPLEHSNTYIALGDSVAAGLGLPSPASPKNNDLACGISGQAYPSRVAASVGKSYVNVACSGATAGDMFTEQHLRGTSRDIRPQLDTAFSLGVPALISITAGANDTRWQNFIRKCYVATCGTAFDKAASKGLLAALDFKLNVALSEINRRSNGQPPRVILTGYYNPLTNACSDQVPRLTPTELTWLEGEVAAINQTISNAAANYSFVRFAPVNFAGHELCTANPWVQGANSVAPFHPTARGQQVIAQSVIAANR